jgi:type I restriction enzyme S subunit
VETIDPKREPEREFWYIDISAVDNMRKRIVSPQRVLGKNASVRARQKVHTNDVLVATTRPNLNAVALVSPEHDGEVCSTGFCVLRPGEELDADYLFSFVRSRSFVESLTDLTKGALYPAVTDKQIFAQLIPWVPLDEQRRIAARLKAQLAEVETARQAAQAQLREVSNLANAIIFDSIGSHPTESHSLGDVLDEVKQGIGPAWAEYPVLGAARDGLAPAKEQPGKQAPKYKPAFPGTVFYNPMRILIGSIAFVDEDDTPGITSPDYVVLQGKPGKVDSRWFYYWLRSPLGAQCITSLARGAVRERMLFNRLAEGEIVLPDFAVQEKASLALKELKPLRRAIENQLAEIDLFPQKILAQAFEYQGD